MLILWMIIHMLICTLRLWILNCVIPNIYSADDKLCNKNWMNNSRGFVYCVCLTGSGRKQSCEEQNIGTQCGATTTNTATETVKQSDIINYLEKQQNQPKLENQLKQLNSQKTQKIAGGSS